MALLAAVCGALIVAFGLLTTRRAPTDAQLAVEATCLVGGLVLIFLGVVLGRLAALGRRLDDMGAGRREQAERPGPTGLGSEPRRRPRTFGNPFKPRPPSPQGPPA